MPNTLLYINDTPQQSFGWDQKGNMVFHHNGHSGYDRKLCWDEQNRLLGVKDEGKLLSYYLYDANGDRTYKFTGEYTVQNQSGQWHYYYLLNSPTLYASPYLVTNKKGYTKHYYAESERIASRIGGGGLYDLHKGFENYPDMVGTHKESSAKLFYKVMECLDADALPQEDALKYLYKWKEVQEVEKDCYWYHPDHLGSSSWITFSDGKAVQHLHYLPWGEDFVDQRNTTWNAMYTFSAKEKDAETGYSYFGARYYSSYLSVWLSVDPMAAKYPFLSSYVYCADNPVKLVDPNGMEYGNFVDENGSFLGTDGKNDGIVYAVADEAEQEMIRENNTKGINTDVSKVNSAMILPNAENRSLLVEMSQSCDNDYPNTENGGIWGYNLRPESMNQEELRWANQGYTGNPDIIGQSLSIDYNSVDDSWFKKMGFFHFHPSGNWVQEPSQADYENAVTEGYRVYGTSFVFGNDNYVVYMYNSKGYKMQMSFDNFVNAK